MERTMAIDSSLSEVRKKESDMQEAFMHTGDSQRLDERRDKAKGAER